MIYGQRPHDDNPARWALALEVARFTDVILEQPEHAHLANLFTDRKNPQASRLSYVLAGLEDASVQALVSKIVEEMPRAVVNTYMFDGAEVVADDTDKPVIERIIGNVGEAHSIRFAIKARPALVAD